MSFLEDNLENCKIGFKGEDEVRQWFIDRNIPFMQVDIMFKHKNKWCLGEIKSQEKFESPPFDGHGLPKWQVKRRLDFYNATGIIPYLIVRDLDDNCLYIKSLLELEKKEKFYTKGKKPRVVYKLENFNKIEL